MVIAVAKDPATADLSPRDRAMVDYAVKLTLSPGAMEPGDLDRLRDQGFEDEAILWLAEVVGYFNYVNRMADGLGVTLEPGKWDPLA
ncbi:MAG: peroxidase [Candidatus Eisenbacteria bacterium]|uniref:Peroxidase n=1 Tax=Eiseniibacteriota bacterium TaxID=2212470 RepID=A0A7Y2EDD6_UNCEI|nr:peroxidase [Candidatus Eisenbacteria bacterium]